MPRKPALKKSDPVPRTRGRPKSSTKSPLTRRQELFVKELVANDGQITLREAAINAGYPASSAHTRAYELTNPHISPHVVAAIKSYRDELDQKFGITYQRHLRDLALIKQQALAAGAFSAAVQAEYRRGQTGGLYINKSEIRHGSIDSMSKEEVEKALTELKAQYTAPVIKDITPSKGESDSSGEVREGLLDSDKAMAEDIDDGAEIH